MEEMRQQFEQWAVSRYGENYVRMDSGTLEYDVRVIQAHWECWKASRAALSVKSQKRDIPLSQAIAELRELNEKDGFNHEAVEEAIRGRYE